MARQKLGKGIQRISKKRLSKLYDLIAKFKEGEFLKFYLSKIAEKEAFTTDYFGKIPLISVTSSHIESVGIDIFNREVIIRFYTNALYSYGKYTEAELFDILEDLITAPSVGKRFYRLIKWTDIPYRRIG
jgi:hypothetical protein